MRALDETLRIASQLDCRWAALRNEMTINKDQSIRELARILGEHGTSYAVIGGVAVQVWSREPRTTLDIDLAVRAYEDIPREPLEAAGFRFDERFEHSENWTGPDGTPIQFSDDPAMLAAIENASSLTLESVRLLVAPVAELIRMKLRAARDPERRRSKRLLDLADATALGEQYPEALAGLSGDERTQLQA